MAKVGTAEYDVEISRAKVRAEVDAAGKEIEKGLGQSAERASKEIEDKLSKFRDAAGVGIAVGTAAALGVSIKAASDLNEAQQANNATFRDGAKAVDEFAASASKIGLSKQEALEATSTFGALFVQLGVGTDEAAGLSTEMTQLAADFGSFKNADVTEVIQAQSAAFRGEYDALQRFVPTINAAAVEQQALAETGKATTAELTLQEKALATYTLMMEGAGPALGDFARNQDSAANSTKIANAELKNTSASLGQALLPVYTELVQVVGKAAEAFGALPGPLQTGIIGIGGLTLATGLLAPKIREGVAVMRLAGSNAATFGKNLIGPTAAVEGLGSATDSTTPKMGKFAVALGALGVAAATYELIQLGRSMTEMKDVSTEALKATSEDLLNFAKVMESGFGDTDFGKVDLQVLYAMRDVAAEAGLEMPKLAKAIGEAEAAEQRGAAASEKYGAEVEGVTAAAKGAAGANKELATETKSAADEFQDAADAARELFDARRQAQSASDGVADAERAVTDAYKGVADAQDGVRDASRGVQDAQQSLRDAYRGVEEAAEGVRDAQLGVVDAQEDAADAAAELVQAQYDQVNGTKELEQANRGVEDAEKSLAQAQRESKDAQDALNDARLTAKERLADLEEAVKEQALDEEGARIALDRARERQGKLGDDDKPVSSLDRREAALAVAQAEERLADVLEANAEREAKLEEERVKGVEGSAEVADAKDAIAEAADREKEAEEGLSSARERVVEVQEALTARVVEAQERVVEANDRVVEAQGRVVEAQQGVEDATRRVSEAHDGVVEAQGRVVEAREAIVEAQRGVEEAQRDVIDANLARIESDAAVKEKTDGATAATRFQIDELRALASTLEPGSPLRAHIEGLIGDLQRAATDWNISLNFTSFWEDVGEAPPGFNKAEAFDRRAGGGRVRAGVPYLVGDRYGTNQAEVMVPDDNGVVVPSVAEWDARQPVGAGVGGRDTINIDASGIKDPDQLASSISSVQAWRASLEVH